jgi:endoglucanase
MTPHRDNPLVIGADLRNEVRALWGTLSWQQWATAAERLGDKLHTMNENWLIVVEGLGSANFLTKVRDRPIKLRIPQRVVYSAHVYSWSGWGSSGGRYAQRDYLSFSESMRENWEYLLEEDISPVWVGEFGAPDHPSTGDANYWGNLVRFLNESDADFGYWALNPRKPKDFEKESYSLVMDDWLTPIMDYRLQGMQRLAS